MGEKWRCTRGILIQKILLWHTAALIYQSQAGKPFSYFHKAPTMSRAGSPPYLWFVQKMLTGAEQYAWGRKYSEQIFCNSVCSPEHPEQTMESWPSSEPCKEELRGPFPLNVLSRASLCFIRGLRKEAKLSGGHKDYPQWLTADGG